MLHIPPTNLLLLAAKQEPYKKAYLLTKMIQEFSRKSSGEWTSRQNKISDRKSGRTREKNKREDSKVESNDSSETPDRGETSDIPGLPSGVLVTMFDSYFQTLLCIHCSGHARVKGNN